MGLISLLLYALRQGEQLSLFTFFRKAYILFRKREFIKNNRNQFLIGFFIFNAIFLSNNKRTGLKKPIFRIQMVMKRGHLLKKYHVEFLINLIPSHM